MPNSNFPNGFANGVTVRGIPLQMMHPGAVFWVSSGSGSDGNRGTFDRPFATISKAISMATAGRGDIIVCKPGHAETISAAAGISMSKSGVALIGLGSGALRPTITFATATSADMDIDAANCTIYNFLFTTSIDALTAPIDVNAADFSFINCETRDGSSTQTSVYILADSSAADRMYIDGWVHRGDTAGGNNAVLRIQGGDGIVIKNFYIDANSGTALIQNNTTACTNISIFGEVPCFMRNRNSSDVCVTLHASTTGNIGPNIQARLTDDAANITEAFVAAAGQFFQPINIVNANGESSMQTNITASTDA